MSQPGDEARAAARYHEWRQTMRETENARRFRRDMLLSRVQRHLLHRSDQGLSVEMRSSLYDALDIVTRVWNEALDEEEKADRK